MFRRWRNPGFCFQGTRFPQTYPLQEDGPICQPVWQSVFAAASKRLGGFELHPTQYLYLDEWWLNG